MMDLNSYWGEGEKEFILAPQQVLEMPEPLAPRLIILPDPWFSRAFSPVWFKNSAYLAPSLPRV